MLIDMEIVGDRMHTKEKACTKIFEDHKITVTGPSLQAKTSCHCLRGGPKDSVALFMAGCALKFVPLLSKTLADMVLRGGSEYAGK